MVQPNREMHREVPPSIRSGAAPTGSNQKGSDQGLVNQFLSQLRSTGLRPSQGVLVNREPRLLNELVAGLTHGAVQSVDPEKLKSSSCLCFVHSVSSRLLPPSAQTSCLSILDSNIVEYRSKLWLPCSPNLPGQRQSSFTSARCFSECRHADAIQRCRGAGKRAGRAAAAEKKGW